MRKHSKGIANGLLNSFVSRNNDVSGYWGIGKLYALMEDLNNYQIEIDLISKTILPHDSEFNYLVYHYSSWLNAQIKKQNLKTEYLEQARITLTGHVNEPNIRSGLTAPHRIKCIIKFIDDMKTEYFIEKDIWCRRHDHEKESKSTRKYYYFNKI